MRDFALNPWKSKTIKKVLPGVVDEIISYTEIMSSFPKDHLFNGLWTPRV